MSNTSILGLYGTGSKDTLMNLSITASDLINKSLDGVTQQNEVTVVNTGGRFGRYETQVRIPINVLITKEDLHEIPALLNTINQDLYFGKTEGIELSAFSTKEQTSIAIEFMIYHGYIIRREELYLTPRIQQLFDSDWWKKIWVEAKARTIQNIKDAAIVGNQTTFTIEDIEETGYISVDALKEVEPEPGMDVLWALGIYFFDKIVRNYKTFHEPFIQETDTLMDIVVAPARFEKQLNAKEFFLRELRTYLGLVPGSIYFSGGYHSDFKKAIQRKLSSLQGDSLYSQIVKEEIQFFVDWMNSIYSGGNSTLLSSTDHWTEPFAIENVEFSEESDGITTTLIAQLTIAVNLPDEDDRFTLPVTTDITGIV